MRTTVVVLILLFAQAVCASPLHREAPIWEQRAVKLGLAEARVVVEYYLTDNCNLRAIDVAETSSMEFLDSRTIAEIVKVYVGPFGGPNDEIVDAVFSKDVSSGQLSPIIRVFSWNTDTKSGRIVCSFCTNGDFVAASFFGVIWGIEQKASFHPISNRLSELGKSTQEMSFEVKE